MNKKLIYFVIIPILVLVLCFLGIGFYIKAKKKTDLSKNLKTSQTQSDLQKFAEGEQAYVLQEWQKCLEAFDYVSKESVRYNDAQTKRSECQKKFDEVSKTNEKKGEVKEEIKKETKTAPSQNTTASTNDDNDQSQQDQITNEDSNQNATATSLTDNSARVTLSLPFSAADMPIGLMPMGETINHQPPEGHPEVDFQWRTTKTINIVAAMDAKVVAMKDNRFGAKIIGTESGKYGMVYGNVTNSSLQIGQSLRKGDLIGNPGHPDGTDTNYKMIDWVFGYATGSYVEQRVCPMTYFDAASRSTIEQIWAKTVWPEIKANATEICSNYYKDRNE